MNEAPSNPRYAMAQLRGIRQRMFSRVAKIQSLIEGLEAEAVELCEAMPNQCRFYDSDIPELALALQELEAASVAVDEAVMFAVRNAR